MQHEPILFECCPICNASSIQKRIYKFNYFSVVKCINCGVAWRSNMYDTSKIKEIYCNHEYSSNVYFNYCKQDIDNLSKIRFKNYNNALKRVEAYINVGKLLDVGCGSGAFMLVAKNRGWVTEGVEIAPKLAEKCKFETNSKVYADLFEYADLQPHSYDMITFWDLIEHVIDPILILKKTKKLLRVGGIALFCTPNENSLLTKIGWLFNKIQYSYPALNLHPKEHTFFFSKKSFNNLLKKENWQVLDNYSQEAYFWHDPDANIVHKLGIAIIEKLGQLTDSRYEMVFIVRKKWFHNLLSCDTPLRHV